MKSELTILVHGLWYGHIYMTYLASGLQREGLSSRAFNYPTRKQALDQVAESLLRFVRQQPGERIHFVGHSLGGLVILRMLNLAPELPPGRVVLLGSPIQGSRVVRRVAHWPGASWLLGASREILEQGYSVLPPAWEIGVIAGNRSLGLGRLSGGLDEPNDGTVAVSETELAGITDRITVATTHTGLILSATVYRQTAAFLRRGSFDHSGE